MTKDAAERFVAECVRVLKKGGVMRIATPDLERIATEYLNNLRRLRANEGEAQYDYDWILLELYDQAVRNYPGGMMQEYLVSGNVKNPQYVSQRIGVEALEIADSYQPASVKERIKRLLKALVDKSDVALLKPIKYFLVGKYRFMGELHLWLYDSHSLAALLSKAGCADITVRNATDSFIPDWSEYSLDNPDETASIFIEAKKL